MKKKEKDNKLAFEKFSDSSKMCTIYKLSLQNMNVIENLSKFKFKQNVQYHISHAMQSFSSSFLRVHLS